MNKDRHDWENKLNENERYFVKNILAFFAGSDGIVMENLAQRFMSDTDIMKLFHFILIKSLLKIFMVKLILY